MSFSNLDIRQIDKDNWLLLSDFHARYGSGEDEFKITVKKGFITDGASIPWFGRWLIGHPLQEYAKAAVPHDKGYRNPSGHSRKFWDDILYEGTKDQELNVKRWKQITIYVFIRLGGWWTWRNYRKQEKANGQ